MPSCMDFQASDVARWRKSASFSTPARAASAFLWACSSRLVCSRACVSVWGCAICFVQSGVVFGSTNASAHRGTDLCSHKRIVKPVQCAVPYIELFLQHARKISCLSAFILECGRLQVFIQPTSLER